MREIKNGIPLERDTKLAIMWVALAISQYLPKRSMRIIQVVLIIVLSMNVESADEFFVIYGARGVFTTKHW